MRAAHDFRFIATALLAFAAACGGPAAGTGGTTPTAKQARGVRAAELPYRILRAEGGVEISQEEFLRDAARASAVCLGEAHTNPHDHWAQWTMLGGLLKARDGGTSALGMEMFQRPFQGVLDDFAAGKIDEATMLSRTGWEERWGYDFGLYEPMVSLAVERGAALLALNVESELKKKVSRNGVDNLGAKDRERLPELDLNDEEHRQWWDNIMASMGGAHGHSARASPHAKPKPEGHGSDEEAAAAHRAAAERMYSVQVLWDETMADTAARWLAGGENRQIVILAGNGHCHHSGIVRRLERRGYKQSISVRPVMDDGKGSVARALAEPENDYLFVMSAPPGEKHHE